MDHKPPVTTEQIASGKTIAHIVYALYAVSMFVGITGLIGVIIAHVKRPDYVDSFLASHFRWQIRTFWYALLWTVIGFITLAIAVGWVILVIAAIWAIYRIVKGWLRLIENRPMYV